MMMMILLSVSLLVKTQQLLLGRCSVGADGQIPNVML